MAGIHDNFILMRRLQHCCQSFMTFYRETPYLNTRTGEMQHQFL